MFKIESYVTPWLLGYLDQYVKLRPEDLQLSLWGGDAALYNLDLRLDVLQRAMQLPIIFKSGHIHELKLHVPWTKLGWEPMVITINTVECIVKVRDTAYTDSSSSASGSTSGRGSSSATRARRKIKRQATEDLPPGYLQSILNRVMNNVTFIVNNLILKFVEDDIVLSVNVKSAECYSCDRGWNRAFVDLTPQDLVLRRMINFSDLTICLDKSNTDGHIENYQEPMLYRCFITCRLHMSYDSVNAKLPSQTKMNVMCDRMDALISDTQLPMFMRLIELCVALYYGYLDIPTDTHHEKEDIDTSASQDSGLSLKDEESEQGEEGQEGQGWGAWMWSMVPQILPEDEDMEQGSHTSLPNQPHILSLGFYIQQATLTFKVTEKMREKSRRGQKLTFHPIMVLKAQGVGVEILLQGLTFFNAQVGIRLLSLSSMGPCICGQPADNSPQESLILKCGAESHDGELAYDWGSLFDPACEHNQGSSTHYVVEREEHMQRYTEQYAQQRFGAFWMDYLSTLVLPHTTYSGSQSSDTDSGEAAPFQQEMSTCRFLFGSSQIQVTSSSYHRVYKVLCYAWNSHYEPYKNNRPRRDTGERVQVTEDQLAELEEEIPTCTYHVTLLRPSILLYPASHPLCSISAKTYSTHSRRSRSKTPPAGPSGEDEALELSVSAQRFDLQLLSPMYPGRLVKLVSNIAGPSSNLLYHCHSHTQIKLFSLQVGLQRPPRKGITWRPVILVPPSSTAFYFRTLLLPHLWTNSHLPLWEHSYEVPQVSVTLSKASLMAATQLLASWTQGPPSMPSPYSQALLTDLFPQPGEDATQLCVLEMSASGLEARSCHTPLVQAYTGSLSSVQVSLYIPGVGQSVATTVPVLYGPVDSNLVADRTLFQHHPVSTVVNEAECLAFTVQKPHHTGITEAPAVLVVTVGGLAGCVDPGLLCWFSYMPRRQVPKPTAPSSHTAPAATVDMPLAQATSPLQTGSSHMSVRSNSSHTQPTSSRLFSHSHTASHTPSHPDGSVSTEDATGHSQPTAMDGVTKMLINAFPLLRMMHVQVGVKSSCLFIPKTCVGAHEASGDIAGHVQAAWWNGMVEEAAVVCLPSINIHSVTNAPMDILQDIPITTLHGALISEKLPWTLELSEWSAFTLHPDRTTWPLMSGLSVSSTLGATVQYNPPTSDTIHAIALCLHLDLKPPTISLNHTQVGVLHKVIGVTAELGLCAWHLAKQCMVDLLPGKTVAPPPEPAPSTSHTAQQAEHSAARYTQHEASLTGGTPEVTEAVTTDVSDEVSHLTSPHHAPHRGETGSDNTAKLSVWLQCVLPKLTVRLVTGSANPGEVSAVVEDLALSCDLQRVYCKVKTTVGSVAVHNFTLSNSGERIKAADCPVLVSTLRELPHLEIHSSKVWTATTTSTSQPLPQDSYSSDKMQRFFSLTYTRALCRNVHRKMKRLNVELTSMQEKEEVGVASGGAGVGGGSGEGCQGFYFNDFVSEVCIKMEPLDVVLHLPTVRQVLAVWRGGTEKTEDSPRPSSSRHAQHKPGGKDWSATLPASHTLPLIHVDIGAVRLFLPVPGSAADSATSDSGAAEDGAMQDDSTQRPSQVSTMLHDLFLVQLSELHVQPHADNPLPRYPLDAEVLSLALHSGMMHQTGSCVEDRQFQLTLRGLALSSGVWGEVVATQKEKELQSEQGSSGVQIPALDWNNYLGHRPMVEEVELIPMVTAFDLCLVTAPPIAYTSVETKQHVVVCGLSAEFNVVSDLDLHLSAQQIDLLTKLTSHTMALQARKVKGQQRREGVAAPTLPSHDSGVASEASSMPHPAVRHGPSVSVRHAPANVLITAGRISLTLYSHLRLKTETPLVSPYPPPFSQPPPWSPSQPSKGQRSAAGGGAGGTTADNFVSLTLGMPAGHTGEESNEGDCVAFSFIQPVRPSDGKENTMPAGTVCVCPVVYVYITQPHTVLNTWSADHRLELSCYDVLVKGVQRNYLFPVTEQRVMPDHADFSVFWVETRAGQPDSKTGIPPSLLTLQVSSILTPPVGVKVKVERPIKVSLRHDTIGQVTDFIQQVTQQDTPLHPTDPDPDPGSPETSHQATRANLQHASNTPVGLTWFPGAVKAVNYVGLQTEQVVLSFDYRDCTAASGLLAMTESVQVEVEQLDRGGSEAKVQGTMCWKDVMVKTVYNKTHRTLAGPVTLEADLLLRWPGQGQATPPQVVMGVQSSLLLLCLGQEHLMSLSHLLSGLRMKTDATSRAKKPTPARDRRSSRADNTQLTVTSPTHDDLRSAAFVYLHNGEGGSDWPAPGHAVFTSGDEDSDIDSTLTWAYSEPRIITAITTLPVPFGLHAVHTPDFNPTVSCTLQHWDDCVEEFVTYATFELSEDSGTSVQLPQVRMVNVSSLAVARVWRVVLSKPSPAPMVSTPPPSPTTPSTASDRQGVLLATQLAGTMCLDSAVVPCLVPVLQMSLTVPMVQLHLYNHLLYNGSEVGGRLAGYRLSSPAPQDQQWGVVSINNISVVASHITPPLAQSTLEVKCEGSFEVMDYNSLHLQSVVDPVDLAASLRVHHYPQQQVEVQSEVNGGTVHCHVGRSVLHTINTSVLAWTQFGEENGKGALLFAHLVVCNNTQQTLRFGQASTDENVVLPSGHLYPYSWRSSTVPQQLHMCLDHSTWRWCAPLDVSSEGHAVRVVRARDQRYTLIVQITNLSPVHKQVTVSGQFVVCSRLSQALEVRFQLQEGAEGAPVSLVEAGKSPPSLVAEHGEVTGFTVRLAGHRLPWSHTMQLSGNAMHSNQLLKVLLPDGVSFIHVWCRIFCQPFSETRQKLIVLSPLYVLRSHLPLPLHVRLQTPRTNQQQLLEVKGQGQEYQLHCSGGDVTHQLSFQLGPELGESSPPVVLSTGLVDQMDQTPMTDIDIQTLCQDKMPSLATQWPYTTLLPASECGEKQWSEVEQAGVDINVQLSQYMPGCNTLLVDISPWCLVTNLTPLPLRLLSDQHSWALPHGCTVAPPALKELRLGCEGEGQVWEGPPIPLSEDEVEQHRYSPDLGKVLYLDGQVQVQLLLPPVKAGGLMQVIPLVVISSVKHGMRVVTIAERLRLSNTSDWPLQCRLMAVPQASSKLQPSAFNPSAVTFAANKGKRRGDTVHALLSWQLLQEQAALGSGSNRQPLDLLLYLSVRIGGDHSPWSVPVRVVSSPDGCRSTVGVEGEEGACASLCVSSVVDGGLTYLVVSLDTGPTCWIHNLCPFPLHYGQALDRTRFTSLTVQEETEAMDAVPTVTSGGSSLYTMPKVNATFPQLDPGATPRLHVRAVLPERLSEWSAGVALDDGDTFLHMNGVANIKVKIERSAMVHHVTLSVLNKAEVSAKEVRSRIEGRSRTEEASVSASAAQAEEEAEGRGEECRSGAVVRQPALQRGEKWVPVTVGVLLEGAVVTLQDDTSSSKVITQLLQVEAQRVLLTCYPVGGALSSLCGAVSVGYLQVDNPLAQQGLHDFPVVLQPQARPPPRQPPLQPQQDLTEIGAEVKADSFIHVQMVLSRDPSLPAVCFLDSVEASVKPLSIFFEDSYFYRLHREALALVPQDLGAPRRGDGDRKSVEVPGGVCGVAHVHQQPLRIRHLCVQPVSLLLSVHASVRLFLATDHAPLTLGRFERHDLFTGTQQLAYVMAMHYITAAIFRAGMVVGSLDLLGSPTGLVRSVGVGLSDLVRLPYQGLTRSPAAFVTGVFGGVSSLMRNVTAGMVNSVTNFASSVSRNMDRLSLDSGHQQRQEESRRQRPTGLSSGLQQGLTGFGLSLLGAVAGLVDQPLQSVVKRDSAASAGSTAGSIVAGMGKGLVGIITKPIGGAAELLSQTGQGILQGSGLRQPMGSRCSITDIHRLHLPTSWLKYSMKLLTESSLLIAVSAMQQDAEEDAKDAVMLLTGDMVVVVSQQEDAQQQAFALSQLQCHSPAPAILILSVAPTACHSVAQMLKPSSEDRVAAFIHSTIKLHQAAELPQWTSSHSTPPVSPASSVTPPPPVPASHGTEPETGQQQADLCYEFRLDPHWCQLFVALFDLATNRQGGRGFAL